MSKCQICNQHEAECKDYRFIGTYGLDGKVLSCGWCRDLNDSTICEVIRTKSDPKEYYDEEDSQD